MHGSRFDGDDAVRLGSFWDILKRSIDELPLYREHYEAKGLIADGRVGVGGTSMGGFAALGCMARYDWIRAVASYMGSGYYLDLSRTLYPPLGAFNEDTAVLHARPDGAAGDLRHLAPARETGGSTALRLAWRAGRHRSLRREHPPPGGPGRSGFDGNPRVHG